MTVIRAAKNGYGSDIKFYGKKVYHKWDRGDITISDLGLKLMRDKWIKRNIKDPSYYFAVESMLTDWKLYENGGSTKERFIDFLQNIIMQKIAIKDGANMGLFENI